MATLAEIRQQYPQYADMSDQQIAEGLHKKFYSDMPFEQFSQKIGYAAKPEKSLMQQYSDAVPGTPESYAIQSQLKADVAAKPKQMSLGRAALNAVVRPIAKGVSALPGMAADFGVATRNLLTGSNYELPTSMFNRALDEKFAPPETMIGKIGEGINTVIAGAAIPAPTSSGFAQAPKDFQSASGAADALKLQLLKDAQAKGYSVPPATVNPTLTNRFLESIGGKHATAQQSSLNNQEVTSRLAREAIDAPSNSVLDAGTIQTIRSNAGQAYEAVRNVLPQGAALKTTQQYADDLDKIAAASVGANKSFPGTGSKEIEEAVKLVRVSRFHPGSAIDEIGILRDKASKAFAGGDSALGRSYRAIATALEDELERGVNKLGPSYKDVLKNFRDARRLIAKTHSIEDAANPVTGDISAAALGNQLSQGAPLSGPLREAARFGKAFPKSGRLMNESVGVNQLTANLGLGAAAAADKPAYAGLPLLGAGVRSFMLSPFGQRILTNPQDGRVINPMLLPAGYAAGYGILGQ